MWYNICKLDTAVHFLKDITWKFLYALVLNFDKMFPRRDLIQVVWMSNATVFVPVMSLCLCNSVKGHVLGFSVSLL